MMNETRVNLKHLLEDIRDSYASPLEEVILTELVANALDGKATNIIFEIDAEKKFLRCVDDGGGMKRVALRDYHNIAASAKTRGLGIGFAGVGAKLSLLIADNVVTESKGGHGTKSATEWRMTGPYRAPWKFIPFSGSVVTSRGTAVTIYFSDSQTHLLEAEFVERTMMKHFYPLLSSKFYDQVLKYFYKKQIQFFVNGRRIVAPEEEQEALRHWFFVRSGSARNAAGAGFLVKTGQEPSWFHKILGQPASLPSGLWISTFGKIIKGGWEWLGILPKHAEGLTGLVEIPALSEILTTNKNDFLSDAASLKKYYKYRKAVQEAVLPILRELGEDPAAPRLAPEKLLQPLSQTITGALNQLVGEFPELESLIGARRTQMLGEVKKEKDEKDDAAFGVLREKNAKSGEDKGSSGHDTEHAGDIPSGIANEAKSKIVKAKTAGLNLVLGELSENDGSLLGRIVENTLTINTAHPAWQKAKQKGMEEYHVIVTVSAVLSQFLDSEKNPQEFLNHLLLAWAKETTRHEAGKLL